jgi:hypothetical protein
MDAPNLRGWAHKVAAFLLLASRAADSVVTIPLSYKDRTTGASYEVRGCM